MEEYNLDTPFFQIGEYKGQPLYWTARHAVEGTQVFGGIGAGKTSGTGQFIAAHFLKAGFGGLVLTVKADEKALWERYCKATGRLDDLVIVDQTRANYFNFLDYEGRGNAPTENIVQVLKAVIRANDEGSGSGNSDPFWAESLDQLLYNLIDLCKLAYGTVSVQALYDIMMVLPTSDTQYKEGAEPDAFEKAMKLAQQNVQVQINAWKQSIDPKKLSELVDRPDYEDILCDALPDARTFRFVDYFCVVKFPKLHEKTRLTIEFSVSGFLFRLLRDPVFSLFCRHSSTVTPDDCLAGKIILLNLPVKQLHKIGRDSQIMFKYIWQRAMENCDPDTTRRPVFLWADEAQHFLHEHDTMSQTTARSARIATVYLSQNLPNYLANMGGKQSKHLVDSFLGTLGTKFFHANGDMQTNNYGSEIIGDAQFVESTISTNMNGSDFSMGKSKGVKFDRRVRPEHFALLRTGGLSNQFLVQAYVHLQSSHYSKSPNYFLITFNQKFLETLNN